VLLKPNPKSESASNDEPMINSFSAAQAHLFFSFKYDHTFYKCALVHNYQVINPSSDEITGMAIVKRAMRGNWSRVHIIPLNNILQAIHLILVFSQLGNRKIPKKYKHKLMFNDCQLFKLFYVNRFVDHHAFEICS
jgi:hypothetical protein